MMDHNNAAPEDLASHEDSPNQRKMRKACDLCHRRKVRCNGRQMPNNKCSNCILAAVDCTYAAPIISKRRGSRAYVQELEHRLKNAEKLLHLLCPDTSIKDILEQIDDGILESRKLSKPLNVQESVPLCHPSALSLNAELHLLNNMEKLNLNDDDYVIISRNETSERLSERGNPRFLGKSSGLTLLRSVFDYKDNSNGNTPSSRSNNCNLDISNHFLKMRRQEFWSTKDWMDSRVGGQDPGYEFPEPALLSSLVELYFSAVNFFCPLLHRPTFEASLADQLYKRDNDFGAVVLLVCAVGARFSDDPRVLYQSSAHLSGFALFSQVEASRRPFLVISSIYDAQVYCLSAIYLDGIFPDYLRWNMIGAGIRSIQEIGVHRRHLYTVSVESELWKRAFWVLLLLDRLTSAYLGRMCALREEDFDIELPAECDDQYWTDPDPQRAFKQPPEKPSTMSFFIYSVRLNQIHAYGLRTIYALKRSQRYKQWEHRMVEDLDLALNKWMKSLPDHLRWDPHREDPLLFKQSTILHMYYYAVQIWIHRFFITSKNSPHYNTSFTICINAAHSCCQLANLAQPRMGYLMYKFAKPLFTCAVILLLNIWCRRPYVNAEHEMAEVQKCLDILRILENRWRVAGRARDLLNALTSANEPASSLRPIFAMRHKDRPSRSPARPWSPFKGSAWPHSQSEIRQVLENKPINDWRQDVRNDRHESTSLGSHCDVHPSAHPPGMRKPVDHHCAGISDATNFQASHMQQSSNSSFATPHLLTTPSGASQEQPRTEEQLAFQFPPRDPGLLNYLNPDFQTMLDFGFDESMFRILHVDPTTEGSWEDFSNFQALGMDDMPGNAYFTGSNL